MKENQRSQRSKNKRNQRRKPKRQNWPRLKQNERWCLSRRLLIPHPSHTFATFGYSVRFHDLLLFRNVYSPSVLFEFKDKNKEPLPDMGSGPWLEGASELDSPSRETLPRRNSSGKMGSRSNSYQGLSRRNSNNGRASRQAKSDAEDVFHTSTKQRIYSEDFMLVGHDPSCHRPLVQGVFVEYESTVYREATVSRKHAVHEGLRRWNPSFGIGSMEQAW